MLNLQVFNTVQKAKSSILVVTKYWDREKTQHILNESLDHYHDIFLGIWENRIEDITSKSLPREHVHFIGNIQSQKIWDIVKYCSVIHSLSSLKHALKIDNQWLPISAFIQIKLDKNKDIWISAENLAYFLQACSEFKNLSIIWISGMWAWDVWEEQKRQEFKTLVSLRDKHIPNWLISAGTSRDYEIALNEWIDIVRVWNASII